MGRILGLGLAELLVLLVSIAEAYYAGFVLISNCAQAQTGKFPSPASQQRRLPQPPRFVLHPSKSHSLAATAFIYPFE